jgi:hypothetical protein
MATFFFIVTDSSPSFDESDSLLQYWWPEKEATQCDTLGL